MQAFKLAVGREYRLIDRLDVVPALPPFTGYIQLDFPLWIQVWLHYPLPLLRIGIVAALLTSHVLLRTSEGGSVLSQAAWNPLSCQCMKLYERPCCCAQVQNA